MVWQQLGSDIDGESMVDLSGWSTSISSDGSIVAIGAPYNDGNGDTSGHVRVYQYSSGSWSQLGGDIDGENYSFNPLYNDPESDRSGTSVSLSSDGTIVAIGAPYNRGVAGGSTPEGHVRVYQYSSGSWSQLGSDIDGIFGSSDYSGSSVSLSSDGTTVAIGAPNNSTNGNNSGHVRVYQYSSGS